MDCSSRRAPTFSRDSLNGYDNDGELVAEYRVKRTGGGVDIGYSTGMRSEVRFGYDEVDVRARASGRRADAAGGQWIRSSVHAAVGVRQPEQPAGALSRHVPADYAGLSPRYAGDRRPRRRGAAAPARRAAGRSARLLVQAGPPEAASVFQRRRRHVVRRGVGLQQVPPRRPRCASAPSTTTRFAGTTYMLGVAGMLHEWFRLPDIIGGNAYVGGWLEQGSAFNAWEMTRSTRPRSRRRSCSKHCSVRRSRFSQSLTESDGRFYLALGPFLR